MRRTPLLALLAAAALVTAFLLWRRSVSTDHPRAARPPTPAASPSTPSASTPPPAASPAQDRPFGEAIITDFAAPSHSPEQDLDSIARVLGNLALLVKGDAPLPLGANEEIAAALRGRNRAKIVALGDESRVFNAQGQIIDRWSTPLYFHAASRDRLEIRSAGPDRQMWTTDDVHRLPDGRYLRGAALLAPSLFGEMRTAR